MKFIFVPGFGVDSRIFDKVLSALPDSAAVDWIEPLSGERLEEYARRLAQTVTPSSGCIVVGFSFGGTLAPYIAKEIQAKRCIILSSVKSGKEFPRWYKLGYPLFVYLTWIAYVCVLLSKLAALPILLAVSSKYKTVCHQFLQSPSWRLTYFLKMSFVWAFGASNRSEEPFPAITQIHGANDWIIPARKTNADIIIPKAGHLLLLTHSEELLDALLDAAKE
ncbi:MAG: alpha/beta hydrolase [Thermoguttaceae bacterium]|nr:alpha/beta hydrolase [Thermoguttaceae bacterium]